VGSPGITGFMTGTLMRKSMSVDEKLNAII
jgi:hypothetical protein